MNLGKLSIRYAQALYSLAEEKKLQDVIFSEMNQLVSSFFQVRELSQAISNPLYASQDKLQLLVNAAGVEISDLLKHFFQFVIDKGRESQILFIAMSYRDIHAKKQGVLYGKITSAVSLDKEVLDSLKKTIAQVSQSSTVEIESVVDESLIGGFVMDLNNTRFDASVKTQLNEIRNALTK